AGDADSDDLLAIDDEKDATPEAPGPRQGGGEEIRASRKGASRKGAADKGAADKGASRKGAAGKKRSEGRREAERKPAENRPPAPDPVPPPPPSAEEPLDPLGGPDDDLGAELEAAGPLPAEGRSSAGLFGVSGAEGPRSSPRRQLQKSSEWDSVLLLVGGASLGVLLIVGGFLYLSLTRGAAEDLFSAAESAYGEESYSLAIKRYDQFLEDYSGHEKASLARVQRVAAQLRQVFQDPERGLTVARQELPPIKQEEAFPEIRPELASMLPRIARGFVDQAMRADDPAVQEALLGQSDGAMELVSDPEYIPSKLRRSQRTMIEEIQADVKRVQREIERERTLVETVERIRAAVASGDTEAAYAARQALLNQYPGLDVDERLREAVLAISEKEQEKVERVEEPLQAADQAEDQAEGSSEHQSVILSHGRGEAVAGASGYVAFVLAGGTVFALDASTGDLLWHRFVGMETTTHPFPVSNSPGADAIVVDRRGEEVMRLEAQSGGVVWRLVIGEPFAEPVRLDNHLYVSCRSGRLLPIDTATGEVTEHVRIPQPLEVGPGASPRRSQLYQPADQDNVYVIDSETLECREVFYTGHKPGTIAVPPALAFGYLFILENSGPDFSDLHVLQYDEEGLNLKPARSRARLQGQVLVPPLVGRRRVLVATDRRQVKLYDLEQDGVTAWEGLHGTSEDPIISYPLLKGGYMWIANDRLTKYQVQATTGKLPVEWALSERDVYVEPLRLVGDTIIHIRQRKGVAGYSVGATRINEKTPSWETELAVPVRNMVADGETIQVVNSRGRLFEITEKERAAGIVAEAKASALRDERLMLSLSDAVKAADGVWALSPKSGYNQVLFHRATEKNAGLKPLTLRVSSGQAATQPTPFGDGLIVPLKNGQIVLVDATTGAEQVRPFHPRIEPETETDWRRAAVVDEEGGFVIANGERRIYHVGIGEKPQRHLKERGSSRVAEDVTGPLASIGNVVFVTTRSTAGDTLRGFALPELKQVESWPLSGRLRWGPVRVGERVLVATDSELMCMDARGKRQWAASWEYGPLVGKPLLLDQQLLLATDSGTVLALDAAEGDVLGSVDVGEPLEWGPVVFQQQLCVAARSGVLFVVARPSS
ncbi:MAG: PQQ-binding-like beta-propeller repeat protein, partial [Planctomycetota bacterium]